MNTRTLLTFLGAIFAVFVIIAVALKVAVLISFAVFWLIFFLLLAGVIALYNVFTRR